MSNTMDDSIYYGTAAVLGVLTLAGIIGLRIGRLHKSTDSAVKSENKKSRHYGTPSKLEEKQEQKLKTKMKEMSEKFRDVLGLGTDVHQRTRYSYKEPIPAAQAPADSVTDRRTIRQIGKRNINIWIDKQGHEEPIVVNKSYPLSMGVGYSIKKNALLSESAAPLESVSSKNTLTEFLVVLFGKDFHIDSSIKHFLLPTEGDSEVLIFNIRARRQGNLHVTMCFYYKLNLLHAISIPLLVTSDQTDYSTAEKSYQNILKPELIHLVNKGLDSVVEFQDLAEGGLNTKRNLNRKEK